MVDEISNKFAKNTYSYLGTGPNKGVKMKTVIISRPGFDLGVAITKAAIEIGTSKMIVDAMLAVLPKTIGKRLLGLIAIIGIDAVIGYVLGKLADSSEMDDFLNLLRETGIADVKIRNLTTVQ